MCGIAGVYSSNTALVRWASLTRMTDTVKHRGPDGEGHLLLDLQNGSVECQHAAPAGRADLTTPFVYLGHRRLSILDLSAAGAQPMSTEDASLFLSYNGEIYNYLELRSELAGRGHRFRTGTDTEVILHAYREWGDDCFSRFNGMWALSLLDLQTRRLTLCVDRFGVKPLHYTSDAGVFAFGSEIKQLLPFLVSRRANERAVAEFVATGTTHRTSETCFAGVRRALPGELMTLDLHEGKRSSRRWYSLPYTVRYGTSDDRTFSSAADRFGELFESAVALRMRSDVRVGSCLSGGLDSSSIVGVASRLARSTGAGPLHTFTACWNDPAIDEWSFARKVVDAYACVPSQTFPTWERFQSDLDALLWHQEEPFGSASIFAQWTVMSLARESGVPVLLDGQGADELLGGYHSDIPLHLRDALLTNPIDGLHRARRMRNAGYRVGLSALARAVPFASTLLYRHRIWREGGPPSSLDGVSTSLGGVLHDEYTRGPLQTLLRYEDRNSMAFSIESRCPFMDYRLAEFVFSLPRSVLSHGGVLKPLIRSSMQDVLPTEVATRIGKLGFSAPPFSVDGPQPVSTGGPLSWRRAIVKRWRRRFGLLGPTASDQDFVRQRPWTA
jgi:asparagine synthase (glutamine-hydrolysing)